MCQRHNHSIIPHAVRGAINQQNNASQRDTLSYKHRLNFFTIIVFLSWAANLAKMAQE